MIRNDKPYGHPQSAVRISEKRANLVGLIGWICVMTAATVAGFLIGMLAKH